jgi:hypothetical protein
MITVGPFPFTNRGRDFGLETGPGKNGSKESINEAFTSVTELIEALCDPVGGGTVIDMTTPEGRAMKPSDIYRQYPEARPAQLEHLVTDHQEIAGAGMMVLTDVIMRAEISHTMRILRGTDQDDYRYLYKRKVE